MRSFAHAQNPEPQLEKILQYFRFKKIEKHIRKNVKLLDIGCGFSAPLLTRFSDKIQFGVGIDMAVDASNNQKIRLIKSNLNSPLPLESNYFDIVTSLATLEHLENPQLMLSEIFRVLKPHGTLLLTTPTKWSKPVLEILSYKLKLISIQEISDHKHYFDFTSLKELCHNHGFSGFIHQYFQCFMNNFVIAVKK
ncbi:MAG: class I SAM-dependent methyltransferase [bacterium]|nr:class I SAM-dependent methyltransferase [bacterium]